MKICENGRIREMTEQEQKEYADKVSVVIDTIESRMDKIEKLFDKLTSFLGVDK